MKECNEAIAYWNNLPLDDIKCDNEKSLYTNMQIRCYGNYNNKNKQNLKSGTKFKTSEKSNFYFKFFWFMFFSKIFYEIDVLRLIAGGHANKEIAAQLRISEHTVEAQVAQGMRGCARFLARHGLP